MGFSNVSFECDAAGKEANFVGDHRRDSHVELRLKVFSETGHLQSDGYFDHPQFLVMFVVQMLEQQIEHDFRLQIPQSSRIDRNGNVANFFLVEFLQFRFDCDERHFFVAQNDR